MKRRLLILTVFIALVFFIFNKVEANDVSIDQEINQDNVTALEGTNNNNFEENSVEEVKEDIEVKAVANEEESTEDEWTDFSNAKFEIKKEGMYHAIIEISNITPKEKHFYNLLITSDKSKPTINNDSDNLLSLIYDKESKKFKTIEPSKIANYVELNQDLYVSIAEQKAGSMERSIVSYGNKLTRFSEPKYNDAFFATFMTYDSDQIVTNFTHNSDNNRKLQIKIGKITDKLILESLRDKKNNAFEDLLSYAKSNNSLFNQNLDADKNNGFAIEYKADLKERSYNDVIQLNGLENDEYYFLYIKTDDENGKYTSNEAVTLAQASVSDNKWTLIFYGASDFKWTEWNISEPNVDPSVVPTSLPHTGIKNIIYGGIISAITVIGIFAYKKYKYYNF